MPASRSNQLLGLTGGLAGGWGWADSGQQKGREGAGGSSLSGAALEQLGREPRLVLMLTEARGGWDERAC